MKRYAKDPVYARIERLADLEAKAAIYHALKMVRQGEIRPKLTGWAALVTLEGK